MSLMLEIDRAKDRCMPLDGTLATVRFGRSHQIGEDPRDVCLGLEPLGTPGFVERWQSRRSVETGRQGEIAFAGDGHFFFGHLLLDETRSGELERIGDHAYLSILDWLRTFGGLHLLRVWNVIQDINGMEAGLERYRAFCVGRSRALASRDVADETLPAATCVGASAPGVMISFLAAAKPGRQIENPRQVSAFSYPRRYGPRSPSFSRALLYPSNNLLFVSGTASIVGHETVHPGSIDAQCEEIFRNLNAISDAAGDDQELRALRVYIRHPEQTDRIIEHCRRHVGADLPILPLASSICRSDLLVEIEGLATRDVPSTRAVDH